MTKTTYNPVKSDYVFATIIEHIFQQTAPVSGTEIAKALDIPHGTVMSHLIVAVDLKWIKQTGNLYEPGLRIVGMYSAYKMGLITKIDSLTRDLNSLEA